MSGYNQLRDSVLEYGPRHVDSDYMIKRVVDGRLGKVKGQVNADGEGRIPALPLRH